MGFFAVIYNAQFAYRLVTSASFRLEYSDMKDGAEMDLTRIAHEFLQTDVASVAKIFLVLAVLTPFASLAYNFCRRRLA